MAKRMWDEKEIIEIAEEHGGEGGGAVKSVNGKTGAVVLMADDITANNLATVQSNLERIDSEINRVEAEIPDVSGLQEKLTAGANITIDENNVISATGGSGSVEIDNKTIVKNFEGKLKTSIGGAYREYQVKEILPAGAEVISRSIDNMLDWSYRSWTGHHFSATYSPNDNAWQFRDEEDWQNNYATLPDLTDPGNLQLPAGTRVLITGTVDSLEAYQEAGAIDMIHGECIPVDGATISNEGGVLEANIDNRTIVSEGGPIKSSIGGVYKSVRTEAVYITDNSITIRSGTNQYFYPLPQFTAWANEAQAGDALTVRMSKGWLQQEDYDAEVLTVSTNKLYLFIGEHDETGSTYFLRIRLDNISGNKYNLQAGANFFAEDTTILSLEIPEGEKTIIEPIKPEVIPVDGETIIVEDGMLKAVGGGGGEPNEYIKNASVSGNTLTLTNKDDTTVEFTPEGVAPTNMVTTDTLQTITGTKTFNNTTHFKNNIELSNGRAVKFNVNTSIDGSSDNINLHSGGGAVLSYDRYGNYKVMATQEYVDEHIGDAKLYRHCFVLKGDKSFGQVEFYSRQSAGYTLETLKAYVETIGARGLCATGTYFADTGERLPLIRLRLVSGELAFQAQTAAALAASDAITTLVEQNASEVA